MRIFLLLVVFVLLFASSAFAQNRPVDSYYSRIPPELIEEIASQDSGVRHPDPSISADRSQRRQQDRNSRDRVEPRKRGRFDWLRRVPPPMPYYDPYYYYYGSRYGYCSGPYWVWLGRVQVMIPGNCY